MRSFRGPNEAIVIFNRVPMGPNEVTRRFNEVTSESNRVTLKPNQVQLTCYMALKRSLSGVMRLFGGLTKHKGPPRALIRSIKPFMSQIKSFVSPMI